MALSMLRPATLGLPHAAVQHLRPWCHCLSPGVCWQPVGSTGVTEILASKPRGAGAAVTVAMRHWLIVDPIWLGVQRLRLEPPPSRARLLPTRWTCAAPHLGPRADSGAGAGSEATLLGIGRGYCGTALH